MTTLALADLPWISKRIKACCRRAKLFSTDEILLTPPQQLQQALRIPQPDVDLLLLQVATASAPPPISVLDALNGKSPPKLDEALFADADNDIGSDLDSQASDDEHTTRSARLPSSSIVPPTQGYDGNFPGAPQFVYDSDTDSECDGDGRDNDDMHDDVEHPSTFRPRVVPNHTAGSDQGEEMIDSNQDHQSVQISAARDVLALGRHRHALTTGSNELDALLAGGLRSATLTEIVGESGSGKTQIAIQTCTFTALGFMPLPRNESEDSASFQADHVDSEGESLRDILQGYGMSELDGSSPQGGTGVCYITSAGERGAHSVVGRSLELADHAIRERFDRVFPATEEQDSQGGLNRHILLAKALELGRQQVLRNVHVACVADVQALEHALKYSLPGLISRLSKQRGADIGLVVIDNLPSLFQEDPVAGDIDSLVQRSKMLIEIAEALKRLASSSQSGRAVLVLNHVSDAFGVDKEIARRFVFDSADRIRLHRSHARPRSLAASALPDSPVALDYASQSALVSGLLASVPPTLAEAIGANAARADDGATAANDGGPLYVLHPRTAQLGHTWTNLINVRLFLSKTRGRVAMPSCDGSNGEKPAMTTVRKAAVVLNPFGPTMLDPPTDGGNLGGRKATASRRQLRFAITPAHAVHALNPYHLTNTTSASSSTASAADAVGPSDAQAIVPHPQGEDEDEEFGGPFDVLEDHHLLAIDRLIEESTSLPDTPVS